MFAGILMGAFAFFLFVRWLNAYTVFQEMQVGFWAWFGLVDGDNIQAS